MLEATAQRYLAQLELSLHHNSVARTSDSLRRFCRHLVACHPELKRCSEVGRTHVESYKLALAAHVTAKGTPLKVNTLRMRLGMLMTFFDRIIEWGYEDAPVRNSLFISDIPRPEELLPKALDDAAAARFLREVAAEPEPLRRLVLEDPLRTGIRWRAVRTGKRCRGPPVGLVVEGPRWESSETTAPCRSARPSWSCPAVAGQPRRRRHGAASHQRGPALEPPLRDPHGEPGGGEERAGIGHVHPHQLRHTLATQAVNRGMRLESIAELLGHRTLRMTIRYARIANKTVADEYRAAVDKVEALYEEPPDLPETPEMRRLRLRHSRMLGNGWCTKPSHLDCSFESLCEGCGFYRHHHQGQRKHLKRQRDHAAAHGQASAPCSTRGCSTGSKRGRRDRARASSTETSCVVDEPRSASSRWCNTCLPGRRGRPGPPGGRDVGPGSSFPPRPPGRRRQDEQHRGLRSAASLAPAGSSLSAYGPFGRRRRTP